METVVVLSGNIFKFQVRHHLTIMEFTSFLAKKGMFIVQKMIVSNLSKKSTMSSDKAIF